VTATLLMVGMIICFQAAAFPAIVRVFRRDSAADLSVWREVLVILGAALQLGIVALTDAAWQLWVSPIASIVSCGFLMGTILWYRRRQAQ
jgi:hypothetical protein